MIDLEPATRALTVLIAAMLPVHEFLTASVVQNPHGTPGLFGPPVAVPADAVLFDRVIGLTGRNPNWILERTV